MRRDEKGRFVREELIVDEQEDKTVIIVRPKFGKQLELWIREEERPYQTSKHWYGHKRKYRTLHWVYRPGSAPDTYYDASASYERAFELAMRRARRYLKAYSVKRGIA